MAALCYDALLLLALLAVLTALLIGLRGGAAIPPQTWWFQGLVIGICTLFYSWFWTHGGQTLGMRAWRLHVRRADGRPVDWPAALARFAYAFVAWLPLGLGVLWCAIDARRRAWHDTLSGTEVVLLTSIR